MEANSFSKCQKEEVLLVTVAVYTTIWFPSISVSVCVCLLLSVSLESRSSTPHYYCS
jgi:hypothetical protein